MLLAQNVEITGRVIDDATEEGLSFVSVSVEGTTIGTATDNSGNYSIRVPANSTLAFSFVGYETVRQEVGNRTRIDVRLKSGYSQLDEVIVIAYGTATRGSVTGAIGTVSSATIEKRTATSALSSLEGNVTGISVVTGGSAGSSPSIRIRGYTSITGENSPLYVVDGTPLAGNIQDINPQDIESISVLKDAPSAALYGNRASNGVIIITTKKGRAINRVNLRLNMTQGIYTQAVPYYDTMNPDEFMETMWRGYYNYFRSNPTEAARLTPEQAAAYVSANLVDDVLKYNIYDKANDQLFGTDGQLVSDASVRAGFTDLDWWDAVERLGHRQEYYLSADAVSEKGSYFLSAGYLDEQGYVKGDTYKRFTTRGNLSMTPKDWLTLSLNMNGSHQISDNMSTGTSYASLFYSAKNMSPIYPIYLHDMTTGDFILDDANNRIYDDGSTYSRPQHSGRHAIWENELNKDRSFRTTLGATGTVSVKFLKDFTFNLLADVSLRNTQNKIYDNSIIGDGQGANGRAGGNFYRYMTVTAQQQLTWGRNFGLHNVDAMVVHENYQNEYDYNYMRVADETFYGQWDVINFNSYTSMTGYDNKVRTESYLGRVRYNYDNKYYFDASLRRDGSSRFDPANRWGNFWSAGASWLIHREKFMQPYLDKINVLRLRASYGEVGNDRSVASYAHMGLYAITTNASKGAIYKNQNEAPDITWESSTSWGVGLETRLFDRLNLEVEYFSKESHDMLFELELPLSVGSTSASSPGAWQTINEGNMANRGVEITLNYDVIQNRDLRWSLVTTGTFMKNKITRLPEQMVDYETGYRLRRVGEPLYNWYFYDCVGVDQMTGQWLYNVKDEYQEGLPDAGRTYEVIIDGTVYTTHYTYARQELAGDAIPDFTGSFGTTIQWKNLTLSALCTYSLGGKMYDGRYASLMSASTSPTALHRDFLKAWNGVPEGMTETSPNRIDPNLMPAPDFYYSNYRTYYNQKMLHDMSYFSIRNVNLSYSLPQKWMQAIDIAGATVNLGVENLWMTTKLRGMNPQQSFSGSMSYDFDTSRIYTLGLNVRF